MRDDILMLAPTSFFSDYGCHVRILEEAAILHERGYRQRIVTYHRGRDIPWLNIARIPHIPWGRGYAMGSSWHKLTFDTLLFFEAFLACRKQRPGLIHAFLHEGAWVGYALSRLFGVPLVFDYQGSLTAEMVDHGFLREDSPVYRVLRTLEMGINNLPDAIITSSAHAAVLLKESYGCRCQTIVTVPDGVDARRFCRAPAEDVLGLRRQLGLPASGYIVAYLGKLAGYQGTELLLEAGAILCARRTDIHLLIMGYPCVEEYRAKAESLGLAGRVTFAGRVPYEDAPRYLALADVAVAPKHSETEGHGKLLNYMAMGLPTVAFDTPVAREYLGHLGRYAISGDAGSLADAVDSVLCEKAETVDLAWQLRERAVQHYSWRQAGDKIEQVYRTVQSPLAKGRVAASCSGRVEV
jgi:glycosyltransferase involved in cell wall biosynthesis